MMDWEETYSHYELWRAVHETLGLQVRVVRSMVSGD